MAHQAELVSYYGNHVRWLTTKQAEQLQEAGHAVRISRKKAPLLRVRMLFPIHRNSRHYCDPVGITHGEILANAGLMWSRGFTKEAQDKVRAWPDEHDRKAPLGNVSL